MDIPFRPIKDSAYQPLSLLLLLAVFFLTTGGKSLAGESFYQPEGSVAIGQYSFDTTEDYLHSDYFRNNNMRCGSRKPESASLDGAMLRSIEDCTFYLTYPEE